MKWIKRLFTFLLLLIVFFWGVLFTSENTSMVPLNLLIIELSAASISVWLIASFALGGLAGMFISLLLVGRLKMTSFRDRKKLARSEVELSRLRTVALRDDQ